MPAAALPPDRLFPADPRTRDLARELHALVSDAPIVSPHGHVDPRILVDDAPFPDPAALLITGDHYVTRLLHAGGASLPELGIGSDAAPAREVWRRFCAGWPRFAGTASAGWLTETLAAQFGITDLAAVDPDLSFDTISAALARPESRPRALFASFRIAVLATTDDPLDDLAPHAALAASELPGHVIPTFRPDAYLDPADPRWGERVEGLLAATGGSGYSGYLHGLESRRRHFIDHGAVSADHGVLSPRTITLDPGQAAALFDRARAGRTTPTENADFLAHMLTESARMSVEDGLVMTIHAGALRGHHAPTTAAFGPDRGHDIPVATEFTRNLRPLLERFGTAPGFHLILFTLDESTWSRELAPLAGFYPSVYVGAPWWFLDASDAIRRFRAAVTETAGFWRGSGFIDDTRAFLSIPARHEVARRLDAGYLAGLVVQDRLTLPAARRLVVDLVDAIPRAAFKL